MKKLFLLLFLLFAAQTQAADRFAVDTGGSGTTCSIGSPCTLAVAQSSASASDTINVRAGTYTSGITNALPSGTAGSPTIIQGCPASACGSQEIPVIRSTNYGANIDSRSYQTLRNLKFEMVNQSGADAGISVYLSSNILIEDVEIDGGNLSRGNGILIINPNNTATTVRRVNIHDIGGDNVPGTRWHGVYADASGIIVENSRFANVCNYSIHNYSGEGFSPSDNIFRFNTIDQDGTVSGNPLCASQSSAGILSWSGSDNQIYGNVISNGVGACISIAGGGHKVYNNTCYNHPGFDLEIPSGGTGYEAKNNIFYLGGGIQTLTGVTASNNLTTDPSFVNAGTRDFRLLTGSSAIGAGADLGALYNVDIAGVSRPQGLDKLWEIGAFEFPVVPVPSRRRIAIQY